MASVGPFAESGLNEAFGFAVGARSVRASEVVANAKPEAGGMEVAGAIAGAVVGEQAANVDAVLSVEGDGGAEEGDGGLGGLIGEHAGEGEAGMIVDGDVQSLPAGKLRTTTAATIAANGNPLITGHSLDVEMQHVARSGVFVTDHRRSGMEIAPAAEMGALQDTADGGGTEQGSLSNLIGGAMLTTQGQDLLHQVGSGATRTMAWPRRTVPQTRRAEAR